MGLKLQKLQTVKGMIIASAFPVIIMECVPDSRHSVPIDSAAAAKSLQLCLTLCDPRDGSQPGSPTPGILQARTLEWVAISFSNA